MAVTRINNNQITDASAGNVYLGINANTKLQNYSITSNKIANNLTYGSDLTVTGNLTVQGSSTAIDTTITTIEDPVIVLASTQTGSPTVDIGFIGQRGTENNIAFVWNEANSEFVTAFTTTDETSTVVNINSYANLHTNDMLVGGTTSLVGNIVGAVNATDTITGGNLATGGTVSATGNVTGGNVLTGGTVSATGTATAGNIATGGTVSATGTATAGNLATGGTVSATGTITSADTITGGNVATGGTVSATGNITAGASSFFIGNGSQLTGVTASSVDANNLTGTTLASSVVNSSLTSVGALTTLSVVGTATSGNLATAGTVSATGTITSANTITGGNVATAGTVSATGDITGGNVSTGGLITATGTVTGGNLQTAGTANVSGTATVGSLLTGNTVSAAGTVTGGNVATAGTVSATGTVTGGNLVTSGTASVTGTITGGNVDTAGTVSATGTITGGNVATGGTVSATGNITAGASSFFIGNGSQLTGVTASSANAETLTGVFLATNVLASSLTSVGALTDLSVVGSTTSGNLATGGTVSATGDITGGNVLTGGTVSATGTVTGGNVATAGTVSATGTVTGGNVATAGTVSATGTATAGNLATGGTVSATGTITGGNVATAGTVSATGNVTGGNVITDNIYSTANTTLTINASAISLNPTGNVNLNSRYINNLALPVQASDAANKQYVDEVAQGLDPKASVVWATTANLAPYTYSNGTDGLGATLTLTATGNLTIDGNVVASGQRVLIKNEVGAFVNNTTQSAAFNGIYVVTTAGAPGTAAVLTRALDFDNGSPSGEIPNAFTFVEDGTVNADTGWVCTTSAPVTVGTTQIVFSQFSGAGSYTAGNALSLNGTQFNVNVDLSGANTIAINGSNQLFIPANATLTTPNIGAATGTSVSVTGTATAGNLATAGTISATGTATAGNIATGGTVSATGTATAGNLATSGTVSATGDITGGNVATSGTVSATGTVTGGNVATSGTISGTGTITGGNIATSGTVSATGNITANASSFFIGNGSQLTGVTASSVDANNLTGTTLAASVVNSSLTQVGSLTTLSVVGTATVGNVATSGTVSATGTVTGGNVATSGTISATGTATAGNIATSGTVSATGSITGGNLYTGGDSSATGTLTGGNIVTGGTITSTGTVTGGNIATGGTVSATGTVTGGNVETGGTLSATGTATLGNVSTSGTVSATGTITSADTITGGNIATGGTVSATGNITAGASSFFIGNGSQLTGVVASSANAETLTGVFLATNVLASSLTSVGALTDLSVVGSTTSGNLSTGGTVSATGDITGGNVLTGGQVSATGNVTAANFTTSGAGGNISGTGNITGGNIATAGQLKGGNIVISGDDITDTNGRVNFNTAGDDVDFAVNGDTVANVFYVDAGVGTASFGSATQTTNSVVAFNATNSILMPVGNTTQRPTGTTGQFRFNTTINSLEIYDNSAWVSVGQPDFTLITDEQFSGTGSQTVFTLNANATTAGTIVSINGVQQIPVSAYAVTGATLTFTEAPEVGDLIDVRVLTTTTTVYGLSNSSGTAQVNVVDGSPVVAVTGDLSVSGSILGGNINSTAITFGTSNMAVVTSGGNIRANVAGTTVQTISPGLVAITGDLTVSGNATLSGNILGDRIQNGSTQIDIQTPSGNANITVGGTSNVAVFTTAGVNVTGVFSATGNIVGGNISATNHTGTTVSVTGQVTGSQFNGSGAGLTSIPGANVTGTVASATSAASATTAGTVTTAAQAAITSLGTLTGLTINNATTAINNGAANGSGNIGASGATFNTVFAKATTAQYADLAEKYTADAVYAPGTVLVFGGTAEVTVNAADADRRVAGVVSTDPGFLMNEGLATEFTAAVALTGRVPCFVVGPVRKGDLMVAAGLGRARAESDPKAGSIIGKALEDFDGVEGTIEVVVGRF